MTDSRLQALKWACLTILKIVSLLFIGWMVLLQIPEISYDLGPKVPVAVSGPQDLVPGRFSASTFVAIEGKGNFEQAFVYRRYGLSYSYFTIEPYGYEKIVVRTIEPVTDQWRQFDRFVGRLRPFRNQPFSYRIASILEDKFKVKVSQEGFFLALYDKPELNGWQVGAAVFATLMWFLMFYLFFFHRGRLAAEGSLAGETSGAGNTDVETAR